MSKDVDRSCRAACASGLMWQSSARLSAWLAGSLSLVLLGCGSQSPESAAIERKPMTAVSGEPASNQSPSSSIADSGNVSSGNLAPIASPLQQGESSAGTPNHAPAPGFESRASSGTGVGNPTAVESTATGVPAGASQASSTSAVSGETSDETRAPSSISLTAEIPVSDSMRGTAESSSGLSTTQQTAPHPPVLGPPGSPGAAVVPSAAGALGVAEVPVVSGDGAEGEETVARPEAWPMAGGSIERRGLPIPGPIDLELDIADPNDLRWSIELGTQTYGNPIIAEGRVLIGTNNAAGFRASHPGREDRGVLVCVNAETGVFEWQLTREKLPEGMSVDWPQLGICSSPCVKDSLVYVVTNRCELVCLDIEGFGDNENDGPFVDEVDREIGDADIVWLLDMREELGVEPHNITSCNPLVYGDLVYTLTSNGIDQKHASIPAPEAPSFLAVNRLTGEIAWSSAAPSARVMHGQWGSPALGMLGGQAVVVFPGGDGWLYGFSALEGDELWRCDLNPKESEWTGDGKGTRNPILATPVIVGSDVIVGVGDDPELGDGVGHLYRIRGTGRGDVSPQIVDESGRVVSNVNSAVLWHYGGIDLDGSVTGEEGESIFRRTISAVAVSNGLVIAPEMSGRIHCVDFVTGERVWEADELSALWTSPLVVDRWALIGDEEGELSFYEISRELKEPVAKVLLDQGIYSNPAVVGDTLYVADRTKLYAIRIVAE